MLAEAPAAPGTQYGTAPPEEMLDDMFDPVPKGSDPDEEGLGISPQLLMSGAQPSFWEGSESKEASRCLTGFPVGR